MRHVSATHASRLHQASGLAGSWTAGASEARSSRTMGATREAARGMGRPLTVAGMGRPGGCGGEGTGGGITLASAW